MDENIKSKIPDQHLDIDDLWAVFNSNLIPFFTYDEFADIVGSFIKYLRLGDNRSSLLYSGYPAKSFNACLWFYDVLSRLYPTKFPYSNQGTNPRDAQPGKLETDSDGNIIFRYIWIKEYFWEPISSRKSPLPHPRTKEYLELPLAIPNEYLNVCDYEEAPNIRGFTPDDVSRIEEIRAKMLNLEIEILKIARNHLQSRESENFWNRCFAAITQKFSGDEIKSLNDISSKYKGLLKQGVYIVGEDSVWSTANCGRDVDLDAGGLEGIIDFVYFVEQELSTGTFHRLKSLINSIMDLGHGDHTEVYKSFQPVVTEFEALFIRDRRELEAHSRDFKKMFDERLMRDFSTRIKTPVMVKFEHRDLVMELAGLIEKGDFIKAIRDKNISGFAVPTDTKWEDIRIEFMDEQEIKITTPSYTKRTDYKELGFNDGRNNRPNKQWRLLKRFAENNGKISWDVDSKPIQKKHMRSKIGDRTAYAFADGLSLKKKCHVSDNLKVAKGILSKMLRSIFGLEGDPIKTDRSAKTYQMRIRLIDY